jgi:hypothetical protein
MDELGATIGGKIQAKDKILLTDSCHSGAIRPEDVQDINHTLIDLNKSLFSLTASRDREVSYEGRTGAAGTVSSPTMWCVAWKGKRTRTAMAS